MSIQATSLTISMWSVVATHLVLVNELYPILICKDSVQSNENKISQNWKMTPDGFL